MSDLFSKCLQYAESIPHDKIFILSAKYGLLGLNELVDPYEETLKTKSVRERRAWASRVIAQIKDVSDTQKDRFIFLAGKEYREYLEPHLAQYELPLKGLKFGQQKQFLKQQLDRRR